MKERIWLRQECGTCWWIGTFFWDPCVHQKSVLPYPIPDQNDAGLDLWQWRSCKLQSDPYILWWGWIIPGWMPQGDGVATEPSGQKHHRRILKIKQKIRWIHCIGHMIRVQNCGQLLLIHWLSNGFLWNFRIISENQITFPVFFKFQPPKCVKFYGPAVQS